MVTDVLTTKAEKEFIESAGKVGSQWSLYVS
jgi:hypothetical protein